MLSKLRAQCVLTKGREKNRYFFPPQLWVFLAGTSVEIKMRTAHLESDKFQSTLWGQQSVQEAVAAPVSTAGLAGKCQPRAASPHCRLSAPGLSSSLPTSHPPPQEDETAAEVLGEPLQGPTLPQQNSPAERGDSITESVLWGPRFWTRVREQAGPWEVSAPGCSEKYEQRVGLARPYLA